ncbi:hypothetical protein ON010_g12996 [Phytophthora cinnamomi]|nr:hypothetical protein ON010_g12996 [Phytophthora cinnamomi]
MAQEKNRRGKSYQNLENLELVKAYVHVSTDASVGITQSAETFWTRIKDKMESSERIANGIAEEDLKPRAWTSLQARSRRWEQKLLGDKVVIFTIQTEDVKGATLRARLRKSVYCLASSTARQKNKTPLGKATPTAMLTYWTRTPPGQASEADSHRAPRHATADISSDASPILHSKRISADLSPSPGPGEEGAAGNDDPGSSEQTSGASRGSRERAFVDYNDELYYVSALKTYAYVIVICETQNMTLRNRQIAAMKVHAGKPKAELPLVPPGLDPYQRVYICTHWWKTRTRSKGLRPAHKVKGVGCQMRFWAQWVLRSSGNWRIQIKNAFYGHCHPVSQECYRSYPSVRQVPENAPIMKDIELMVARVSKASRIYEHIRANSPHYVQLTDVHNMIARIKKSGAC